MASAQSSWGPQAGANDASQARSMQRAMAFQHGTASARADAIQTVQRSVAEVAQMFQRMAVLVTAQQEMVQRIDDEVGITLVNVEQGQDHLLRYFKRVSGSRGLILKVFFILLLFVVFFVVFLA